MYLLYWIRVVDISICSLQRYVRDVRNLPSRILRLFRRQRSAAAMLVRIWLRLVRDEFAAMHRHDRHMRADCGEFAAAIALCRDFYLYFALFRTIIFILWAWNVPGVSRGHLYGVSTGLQLRR